MPFLDTIVDLRYDPFSQVWTPQPYGYEGEDAEAHTIPASSPYRIFLNELPRQVSPSEMKITNSTDTFTFTEVSQTTTPAAGQYRVIYGGSGTAGDVEGQVGQGMIEFHSSDAGTDILVSYYGLGSILQRQLFVNLYDEQFLWSILL